jgi:arylformamidase
MDKILYDATLPLHPGTILFPGDPAFELVNLFAREKGDSFELARIIMGTHAGTHVDAPKHFLDGGASVDEIPLGILVGAGAVVDLRGEPVIDEKRLEKIHWVDRILFKTDNGPLLSEGRFQDDFVSLTEGGAGVLIEKRVKLVGIDYPTIEKTSPSGGPVHRMLLQAGIVIVESVDLLEVPPGPYEILCLPLRIQGADGAPARVILRKGC